MKNLKIKNRTSSPLYFVFCTISCCTCDKCREWLECETLPIYDCNGATYGVLVVDAFAERVGPFCYRWDCVGACFFESLPTAVSRDDLFDYDEGKSYTIGDGKADVSFTYTGEEYSQSNGLKYRQIKNQSDSTLYFAFCTMSKCECHVCQEWIQFETIPLVDVPGWTVGRVVVDPFECKVERFCSQWDCIDYTIAGGKAELCFSYEAPQLASQQMTSNKQLPNLRKGAGLGVVGAISTANQVYNGCKFVQDIFDGTTGPEDDDLADSIGAVLEEVSGECVIS